MPTATEAISCSNAACQHRLPSPSVAKHKKKKNGVESHRLLEGKQVASGRRGLCVHGVQSVQRDKEEVQLRPPTETPIFSKRVTVAAGECTCMGQAWAGELATREKLRLFTEH